MTDQEIYSEIGKLIWSVFITEADLAIYRVKLFDSLAGERTMSLYKNNALIPDSFENPQYPVSLVHEIADKAYELQTVPPFANESFTHLKYTLTDKGKMDIEFAYIPEWDSWPGLFYERA